MKLNFSTKRIQINKANARIVVILAVASFLVTFSLIASKGLLSQRSYQSRVISKKKEALTQLEHNAAAAKDLITSYEQFVDPSVLNILGGNPQTEKGKEGDLDGDNARIVLDALPSKYDFPAVATSIEKIVTDLNITLAGINGADDEIAQKEVNNTPQADLVPIEIPFQFSVSSDYKSLQALLKTLERSIRPIYINTLSFSGTNEKMTLSIQAQTYYQPPKSLTIQMEQVR
jgi:hypothetical protein